RRALPVAPALAPSPAAPGTVLSTSFGFGGNNAALVLASPERATAALPVGPPAPLEVTSYAVAGAAVALPCARTAPLPPPGPHRRRARLPSLALALARAATGERALDPHAGVYLGTAWGSLTETEAFLAPLLGPEAAPPSPRAFTSSVHNAAAGEVARALGLHGENQTFVQGELSFACCVLAAGRRRARGEDAPSLLGALDERTPTARDAAAALCPGRGLDEGGAVLVVGGSAPPLARLRLLALGSSLPGPADDHADLRWTLAPGARGAPLGWTGEHPSAAASAAALAVALVSGELAPAAVGCAARPRSVLLELSSRWGERALLRVEAP
ncbi:MAG: hypothetical protein D6731_06775, partial [Planctomycetota bacterium]